MSKEETKRAKPDLHSLRKNFVRSSVGIDGALPISVPPEDACNSVLAAVASSLLNAQLDSISQLLCREVAQSAAQPRRLKTLKYGAPTDLQLCMPNPKRPKPRAKRLKPRLEPGLHTL